jgi:7-carboxy-7-deazaguanine synthase
MTVATATPCPSASGPLPQAGRPSHLLVSEIFHSLQGEGASLGRPCAFLRLGGCNLACSWCDTPYTWDWTGRNGRKYDPQQELRRMTPEEILPKLVATGARLLVVSGGEPMLQYAALCPLLDMLRRRGWRSEVETNGTVLPPSGTPPHLSMFDRYTVSLKLVNSRNGGERLNPDAIKWYRSTGCAIWKFVVVEPRDLDEVQKIVDAHGLAKDPVYIMPEGRRPAVILDRMKLLAEPVIARGWSLTPRLHVLLWGDERGR